MGGPADLMRSKKRIAIAAGLLLILGAAWLLRDSIPFLKAAPKLRGAVLILLDTVRADHLDCYGYERQTAPALTGLSKRGVLFEQAISFAPWTLPSAINLLSGCRVTGDVFDKGKLKRSFVETLDRAGYRTVAFTEGGYLSKRYGFDLGFSLYHEQEGKVHYLVNGKPVDGVETGGGIDETFSRAREWLADHGDEPFFLFIHTYEPHTPYLHRTFTEGLSPGKVGETFGHEKFEPLRSGALRFDEKDLEYLEALYDGGIHEADRHVGAFVDFLDEQGLGDKTLIVVTSDHGEELGEHFPSRSGDHGHSLHDTLVHVPLIVHNPMEQYAIARVAQQVRLMDVMPTIVDIMGAAEEEGSAGKSLVPLMRGTETANRLAYGTQTKAGPDRIFLRYLGYKYVRIISPPPRNEPPLRPSPPREQLYDLKNDPGERVNLVGREPHILDQMKSILDQTSNAGGFGREDFTVPEETYQKLKDRLESLGYTH